MVCSRDLLAATAQPQTASPFFDRLPPEIRQKVYEELWALHDTRWHVHSLSGHRVPGPVFPCLVPPEEEDTRYHRFQSSVGEDVGIWEARLRSPWNVHWKCAEAAAAQRARRGQNRIVPTDPISFRRLNLTDPLLSCKRMYLESIAPLEDTFTFCFTDIVIARNFLAKHSSRMDIRSIDISLRLKPIITELYYPGSDGELQPHVGGIALTSKSNPWEDLCQHLAAMSNLRELHLRFDSEDLRPWHKRVNEKKFFEQLSRVVAPKFVLSLPELPQDPSVHGLPGCYVESGDALEKAPFQVSRGPRPNNWQLHLSRISHALPFEWSHNLTNQMREKIWAA